MTESPFHAVGIDLGGTKIAAGLVAFPEGKLLSRQTIPTLASRTGEEILADVETLIRDVSGGVQPRGVGLGICEIVTTAGELASECSIHWASLGVRKRLGAVIEADVRAAATAEALFGAGRDCKTFLYVTIGTGISSCLMIDGKPYKGAGGATGTMASGLLPQFETSNNISLEQIASGPALLQRFCAKGGKAKTAQDVFAAAAAGDRTAIEVIRSAAELLGGTIGTLINVLDPEKIILGGGLGLSQGLYRDTLIAAVRRHIWWEGHRDLPILSAATGTHAGVIGAAAVAWKQAS